MSRSAVMIALLQCLPLPLHADDNPTQRLDPFVGSWDVVVKYQMPDGKEYEGKSTCTTKKVLNDQFLQQEYKSTMMNQPLTIWQLVGYDAVKKKYVEHHFNAHGTMTHTMLTEGSFSDDGKILTLKGETLDAMTGKPTKLRFVTTMQDNDHYTLEWFFTDESGKETRKVVLNHARKK